MQETVEKILAILAKKILDKYKPKVIAITGSHGKTTTRIAIYHAIRKHFRVYTPVKNYNNLLGLPLGIIMSESPGRSVVGWLLVFAKAIRMLIVSVRYPEILVLEYGIDRPGEMDKLVSIAMPDISILTAIGLSHIENYQSLEQLAEEKSRLLSGVKRASVIIVNANDQLATEYASKIAGARGDARFLKYGYFTKVAADVVVDSIDTNIEGVSTELFIKTPTRVPRVVLNAVGDSHVQAAVAATTVAECLGVPSEDLLQGLLDYRPSPGRLNLIHGVKKSIVIDDTYNASPASTMAALEFLRGGNMSNSFDWPEGAKKIFFFGDMLELGVSEKSEHERIGQFCAQISLHKLVCVGSRAKWAGESAQAAGMDSARIIYFENSISAASEAQSFIEEASVVLVKGSQGSRMERIVKELMAEPMKAKDLLCRQDKQWQAK